MSNAKRRFSIPMTAQKKVGNRSAQTEPAGRRKEQQLALNTVWRGRREVVTKSVGRAWLGNLSGGRDGSRQMGSLEGGNRLSKATGGEQTILVLKDEGTRGD